ncbi:MAG: hypothetical protein MZV64_63455 [Ignavibacteriales bacterium]|nr:hypothetical protein [Ignavibacteriales bacterium]
MSSKQDDSPRFPWGTGWHDSCFIGGRKEKDDEQDNDQSGASGGRSHRLDPPRPRGPG